MKSIGRIETALGLGVGALWLLCLALQLELVSEGRLAFLPVYVEPAASAAEYPRVLSVWPSLAGPHELEASDALVAAGEYSLRGAGRIATAIAAYRAADASLSVRFTVDRNGQTSTRHLSLLPVPFAWIRIPISLGLGVSALVVLLRARVRRVARAYAFGALAYALHWSMPFGPRPWQTGLGVAVFLAGGALFQPLMLRAALLFPPGTEPKRARSLRWPWLFLLLGPGLSSWLFGTPFGARVGLSAVLVLNLLFVVCLLTIFAYHYAIADGLGRRQLRWISWGAYVGVGPVAIGAAAAALEPDWLWVYHVSLLGTVVFPVCALIAIVRTHVLDIDRVISATAAYSVLLIAGLGAAFTLAPRLGDALGRGLGVPGVGGQLAISLGLAAAILPIGRRMSRPIERLLFKERVRLEHGVRELAHSLEHVGGPGPLLESVGRELVDLLALDRCAVYARAGSAFSPAYSHDATLAPGFEAGSPLLRRLELDAEPVERARWRRWSRRELLSPAGLGALESLDPAVVLPILRGDQLAAIVFLGDKGSGDIYTPTDLAHLGRLAEAASARMERFDLESLERAQRERYERVAGYVPAPLVEAFERGAEVASGTMEVSALLVDIRGYTTLSASREADAIFRVLTEYTQEVSRVVRETGGTVVQFQGDGLYAVWGAPRSVEHKERAAVDAARRIVAAVEQEGVEVAPGVRLRVGVGIATGEAYVGDIESVDQKVWSVIGNPVNLAARLEALAPTFDATVVIDARTYAAARDAAADFVETREVRVKGLEGPITVYRRPR